MCWRDKGYELEPGFARRHGAGMVCAAKPGSMFWAGLGSGIYIQGR
jgi:hypothetical protein